MLQDDFESFFSASASTLPQEHSANLPLVSLSFFGNALAEGKADQYGLLLDAAKFADDSGFYAIWTPERHFHKFGGLFPNPAVAGAAVAAKTRRIGVRAGSVVLPLREPHLVAEDWAFVDCLSNGRVGISFASGWHQTDFVLAPTSYERRQEALFEGVERVRALWRGEQISVTGQQGESLKLTTFPRPIQRSLPTWITAAGSLSTFVRAGQIGAHVLTHLLSQSPQELRAKILAYRQARAAAGHESPGRVTLMVHTFVGGTSSESDVVASTLGDYVRESADLAGGTVAGGGRAANKDLEQIVITRTVDRILRGRGLFGDVRAAARRAIELARCGVDELACLIDFGLPPERVLAALSPLSDVQEEIRHSKPIESVSDYSIASQLRRHRINYFQCTPTLARTLCADPRSRAALSSVEHLLVGGEALDIDLAKQLRKVVAGRVTNMYGPTEATIWSHSWELPTEISEVLIGRPLPNVTAFVVDETLSLVPCGVIGEFLIGGPTVSAGYLRDSARTAEQFVSCREEGMRDVGRIYRTGDRVRLRKDGQFEFLGRTDRQVKVRGRRVELGEVEAALKSLAPIENAAVTSHVVADTTELVAHVILRQTPMIGDFTVIRRLLRDILPAYMIPSRIQRIIEFPLTSGGKIDYASLHITDSGKGEFDEKPRMMTQLESL